MPAFAPTDDTEASTGPSVTPTSGRNAPKPVETEKSHWHAAQRAAPDEACTPVPPSVAPADLHLQQFVHNGQDLGDEDVASLMHAVYNGFSPDLRVHLDPPTHPIANWQVKEAIRLQLGAGTEGPMLDATRVGSARCPFIVFCSGHHFRAVAFDIRTAVVHLIDPPGDGFPDDVRNELRRTLPAPWSTRSLKKGLQLDGVHCGVWVSQIYQWWKDWVVDGSPSWPDAVVQYAREANFMVDGSLADEHAVENNTKYIESRWIAMIAEVARRGLDMNELEYLPLGR